MPSRRTSPESLLMLTCPTVSRYASVPCSATQGPPMESKTMHVSARCFRSAPEAELRHFLFPTEITARARVPILQPACRQRPHAPSFETASVLIPSDFGSGPCSQIFFLLPGLGMSKAKAVTANIKLVIKAGQAKPAPPIGPALGQAGLNIMSFCKDFNAKTAGFKVRPAQQR